MSLTWNQKMQYVNLGVIEATFSLWVTEIAEKSSLQKEIWREE